MALLGRVQYGRVPKTWKIEVKPGDPTGQESGYGKDLSVYSLEDYTVVKHVMVSLQ